MVGLGRAEEEEEEGTNEAAAIVCVLVAPRSRSAAVMLATQLLRKASLGRGL